MKKIVVFLLVAVVISMAVSGLAEKSVITGEKNMNAFSQKSEKAGTQAEDATHIDMVEINGNQYAILTGGFLGIAYTAPSDYVYVLTQDYLHQTELYEAFYSDPLEMALSFVDNEIHLNIYDAVSGTDIYLREIESELTQYFPDVDEMTEMEIQFVQEYFLSAGFTLEDDPAFKKVGGNQYFVFDCSDTEQTVYMYTFENGHMIYIWYNASTPEQVAGGAEVLESLYISGLEFVEP